MIDSAITSPGNSYVAFDPSPFGLVGELTADELDALRGRSKTCLEDLERLVPRLVVPLLAIARMGDVSAPKREISIKAVIKTVARRRIPYWQWDRDAWLTLLDRTCGSRPYLTAIAYHLGSLRDVSTLPKACHSGIYARAIYGSDIFWHEHARLATTLRSLGYSARHLELFLTSVLGHLMLENGDPRLETFTVDLLQKGQDGRNDGVARAVGKVSNGLAAMGIIETPLRMRNYVGWKDKNTDGVPPEWAQWCARWRETSTLRPRTRETNYSLILRIGLWLAREYPQVQSPADWDTSTCAAFLSAVDHMTVGEWRLESAPSRKTKTHGAAIAANSKRTFLHAMRRFFIDIELWGWASLRFSPRYHLATPKSVVFNSGVKPRVIDDAMWLRLIWASLNLEQDDLLSERWYPLALIQALAVVWTHCGLRQNEVFRLAVGCAKPQAEDIVNEDGSTVPAGTLCYLDVPASKTFRAFVKPVAVVVKERIDAWAAQRPSHQAPLLDERTGERVDFLFQYRGRRVGMSLMNQTIIPILCAKAGLPPSDSMGTITSHRGRASAVTALASVPKGMSLIELMEWSGHTSPRSTMHYIRIRPTRLATSFAQADHMAHMVAVLVDHDAIARKSNEPYTFYDLGDSYCSNPFWSACPHRMACAGCDFNLPKASARAHALESQDSIRRYLEEVPLTADERIIVQGDAEKVASFIKKLSSVATPDGRTPSEISQSINGSNRSQIPIKSSEG
ncbi:tyrosine-type recombinase/integrase [Falsirhodobacter sp. 1013]|uniref:tyrosine-type recombinase/integrase n=1 Tax=Falsirhodobacter sp. 1013 TaxID=3417566 RepID=UPI003EBE3C41